MRDYLNLSLRLMIICVVAAALLGVTYGATEKVIAAQEEAAATLARQEVLPMADSFVSQDLAPIAAQNPNVITVHSALSGNEIVGYAVTLATKGYGGDITMSVGMDTEGIVTGVRIGTNTETAGLGAKITTEDFFLQYDGKKAPLEVKKDIVPISGATISSKGVTDGVNLACDLVMQNKEAFSSTVAVASDKE